MHTYYPVHVASNVLHMLIRGQLWYQPSLEHDRRHGPQQQYHVGLDKTRTGGEVGGGGTLISTPNTISRYSLREA